MSVYVDNVQVGSISDMLASIMPIVTIIVMVMLVISLLKSLMRG